MTTYSITKDPNADNVFALSKDPDATEIQTTKNPGSATATFQKNAATKVRLAKGFTTLRPELVSNGDMEAGATGWTPQGTSTLDVETTIVHAGSQSLKLTRGATGNNASQSVATVVGETYAVSGWVQLSTGTNLGYMYAGTSAFLANIWSSATSTAGSWVLLSGTFQATGTATFIGFGCNADDGDIIYADDISLKLS